MRYNPACSGPSAALNRPLVASTRRSLIAWVAPPGAVSAAWTDASGTGANAPSRATTSIEIPSPGSGDSGAVIATGSGAVDESHRAACRQKNSYARSVDGTSIFQRHDASPANTIDRPRPYGCTATTGNTPPPGAVVSARTVAPGRGPPTAALAASGGIADQILRASSVEPPMRIIGWLSP